MPETRKFLSAPAVLLLLCAACGADAAPSGSRGMSRVAQPTSAAAGSGGAATPTGTTPSASPSNPSSTLLPTAAPSSGLPGATPNKDGTCEVIQLVAQPVIPEMLIVLDRSGSMADGKRWVPSVTAVRRVTEELQAKIHFGLALFPDPAASNGGSFGVNNLNCLNSGDIQKCLDELMKMVNSTGVCAPGKVVVPVAPNNATKIASVLDMTQPSGGTPTSDTLQRVLMDYATEPAGPDAQARTKYVLLVTDGLPTCPAGGGEDTTPPDINASNAAVEALAAKGVRTYVIGYDTSGPNNTMLASVLDGFAQRGGTGDKLHRPVENELSLLQEFTRITAAIASCSFQLSQPPSKADHVLVQLDRKQVNLDQPDGFKLVGDRTVELQGASCTRYREGNHLLEATVQCDVVRPD